MLSELYKTIKTVVWELLFPVSTLIILPQSPVVTVSFDFLEAEGTWVGRGGEGRGEIDRLSGCQLTSSSASRVYNIARFQNQKFCSFPNSSLIIVSLGSSINGIWVIMLQVIINRCLCWYFIGINLAIILTLFTPCRQSDMIHFKRLITCTCNTSTWQQSTATCFGGQLPSSGSHNNI